MFRTIAAVRSGTASSLFRRRTTTNTTKHTTALSGALATRSYGSSKGVTATTTTAAAADNQDSGRRECPWLWSPVQLQFPAHCHRTMMSGSVVTSHSQYRRRGFSSSSSSSSSTATNQDDTSDAVGIDCEEDFCADEATTTAPGAGTEKEDEEDNAGAANDDEDDNDTATQVQDEIAELKNQLLRSLAEQENIRAIARRDVQAARDFSTKSFAKSLLEVADNLERALDSVNLEEHQTEETVADPRARRSQILRPVLHSFVEGIELTHTGLVKALAANGIVAYCDEPGDPFDADKHQALMEYSDPTQPAGTVGTVMKKGYTLNGRVLRAAEVGVIKK